MTTTLSLETPEATLVYDVRGPPPPADGRPPLFLVGAPIDASGFTTLASSFTDRTVVTYDPRGVGRSIDQHPLVPLCVRGSDGGTGWRGESVIDE